MDLKEKARALKEHIEQLESLIKNEEKRRPGYTSPRRADLWFQQTELDYYSKLLGKEQGNEILRA